MVKKALCLVVFAALYPDTGEAFISHRRLPAVKQARSNHKLFALAESSRPEWHKKADKPARAWKRLPTLTESSLPPKQQNALVESVGKQVHSKTGTQPSAAFGKASRWASYERELKKNSTPGPGAY